MLTRPLSARVAVSRRLSPFGESESSSLRPEPDGGFSGSFLVFANFLFFGGMFISLFKEESWKWAMIRK